MRPNEEGCAPVKEGVPSVGQCAPMKKRAP